MENLTVCPSRGTKNGPESDPPTRLPIARPPVHAPRHTSRRGGTRGVCFIVYGGGRGAGVIYIVDFDLYPTLIVCPDGSVLCAARRAPETRMLHLANTWRALKAIVTYLLASLGAPSSVGTPRTLAPRPPMRGATGLSSNSCSRRCLDRIRCGAGPCPEPLPAY